MVIDDLQDLDDGSLALTADILDSGARMRLLAAARPTPGDDRLSRLRGHLSTLEVVLPPLTAPEVAALADLVGAAAADAGEVMAISAGNPFQGDAQAALALAE